MIQALLLSRWTARALWLGVAALSIYIAGYWTARTVWRGEVARIEALHEGQLREIAETRARAEAAARETEQRLRADVDAARARLDAEVERIANAQQEIDRLRLDREHLRAGLRNALAAYAASGVSADSLAACQQRARALAEATADGAELLAEGARLLEQAAAAHDRRAAEVEALLSAWPAH